MHGRGARLEACGQRRVAEGACRLRQVEDELVEGAQRAHEGALENGGAARRLARRELPRLKKRRAASPREGGGRKLRSDQRPRRLSRRRRRVDCGLPWGHERHATAVAEQCEFLCRPKHRPNRAVERRGEPASFCGQCHRSRRRGGGRRPPAGPIGKQAAEKCSRLGNGKPVERAADEHLDGEHLVRAFDRARRAPLDEDDALVGHVPQLEKHAVHPFELFHQLGVRHAPREAVAGVTVRQPPVERATRLGEGQKPALQALPPMAARVGRLESRRPVERMLRERDLGILDPLDQT